MAKVSQLQRAIDALEVELANIRRKSIEHIDALQLAMKCLTDQREADAHARKTKAAAKPDKEGQ